MIPCGGEDEAEHEAQLTEHEAQLKFGRERRKLYGPIKVLVSSLSDSGLARFKE
jgi:hypothetical protein